MSNEKEPIRQELTFSLKEMATLALIIGGLVSSWVNLNASQVETNTKLEAFEKYYRDSLVEYKNSTRQSEIELRQLIEEQRKMNKELKEHVYDLERTISQLYTIRKK